MQIIIPGQPQGKARARTFYNPIKAGDHMRIKEIIFYLLRYPDQNKEVKKIVTQEDGICLNCGEDKTDKEYIYIGEDGIEEYGGRNE